VGEGAREREGCPSTSQAHYISSWSQEDRRRAKGEMGTGEGGKKDSIEASASVFSVRALGRVWTQAAAFFFSNA
jgi:hypothetical protein